MRYIKGPDFPTGGIVVNQDELRKIYETGSGKIRLRGKVEIEKAKGGRLHLVITEIPYTMIGANIGKFLNDVATLVESKKTTDILDISNQSSKEGIRIVLELRRDTDVDNLVNMLYKKTRLEDTFGVNMLAVADGRPETLSLKQVVEHHVEFQFEIANRKYRTLLDKELEKKEVQEGLMKAVDVIDLIIEILRGSKNQQQVKKCLTTGETEGIRFKSKASQKAAAQLRFTERQATAILEMRLYRLIGLEMEALLKEHEATLEHIAKYEDLLNNYDSMAQAIMNELDAVKKEFGRKRRTALENAQEAVFEEKKIEEMEVWFLMDRFGYVKTIDRQTYERNKENACSESKYLFSCMNTDRICIFTDAGRMHAVKVLDIPLVKFRDKGVPVDNLSNYNSQEEQILYVAGMEELKHSQLLFATQKAMLKQVSGQEFDVTKRTIMATKLTEGDKVIFVAPSDAMEYVVLQSTQGYFLRFLKQEVPEKKKGAIGVRGMRLGEQDQLEHAYLLEGHTEYTIEYKEKKLTLNRLRLAKRDTKGTKSRA